MGRRGNKPTIEEMSRRRHEAEMDAVRQTNITEKKKALMPEAPVPCLKERCWCYGTHCHKNREMCNAYF